jgi:hypothetical protein
MVLGLILIASRMFWGRMVFSDNGWTAGAGGYNADRHKVRDRGNGNGIVV